ncbi:MAG: GntR family transcriptional regulator [Thiolinea sp.]
MSSSNHKKQPATKAVPIYQRTRDQLIARIRKGELKAHDALPSERILADELSISRMTARQALNGVEEVGLAYRKGRQGRFVADQRLSYDVGTTLSFATRALQKSLDLSIEVIAADTVAAGATLAKKLAIAPGEQVHTYKRIFKVSGRTVLVERESTIAARFPDLLEQDLSQPSTLLHESRYGVFGSQGRVTIRCAPISAGDKQLFAGDAAPYGMEMDLIIYDADKQPFCCGHQVWCSELAEFTLLATPG